MFTGLIESTGKLLNLSKPLDRQGARRIKISAPELTSKLHEGDSVAVSGVCLTALEISRTHFSADLAQETLQRTTLGSLHPGAILNLERPTPAGTPLGGHIVQGHVDGVGSVIALTAIDPGAPASTDWRLQIRLPPAITRYVVSQGSITVNGISLTVAGLQGDVVSIAVIPHTYAATNLHGLAPESPVNIEVDVLAKYAERQAQVSRPAGWTLTEAYLLANGY